MFEGPSYVGEDQDTLPTPAEEFDVVAEAERLRHEREERERQEKEARDIAHKEELAKKISLKNDSAKSEEKKRWFEIPEKPKDEVKKEEKPPEMIFTAGSEYTDDSLDNGNEAVFDLSEKKPATESAEQKSDDIADHIKAQAEALEKARAALSEVTADEPKQESEAVVLPPKSAANTEEDEIRKRINESWTQAPAEQEQQIIEPDIMPKQPSLEVPVSVEIGDAVSELEGEKREDTELEPKPVQPMEAEIVSEPESAHEPAEEQKNEEEPLEAEILPGPENIPPIPEGNTREDDKYESEMTPEWVRTVKNEVRLGRAPELRKWQKDILGVQYPELLAEYQSVLRESYPAQFEAATDDIPVFAQQFDHMPDYMRPPQYTQQQLPQPLDQDGEGSYMPYAGNPVTNTWDGIKSSAFTLLDKIPTTSLATIMVGGGIFGAVLIIVFGF